MPVLLYGSEAWVLSQNVEFALGILEIKILRRIIGPLRNGKEYRIRMNPELYSLYDDVHVVERIKMQ